MTSIYLWIFLKWISFTICNMRFRLFQFWLCLYFVSNFSWSHCKGAMKIFHFLTQINVFSSFFRYVNRKYELNWAVHQLHQEKLNVGTINCSKNYPKFETIAWNYCRWEDINLWYELLNYLLHLFCISFEIK